MVIGKHSKLSNSVTFDDYKNWTGFMTISVIS